MSNERTDELIALAALGELTPQDERELAVLAERDPQVARALTDALGVAARLQQSVGERAPSGLRDKVLAAVADTPQESPVVGSDDSTGADVVSLAERRRRLGPLLAAAAAVLALVVGGVVLVTGGEEEERDVIAEVVEAPDAVRRVLEGSLSGELAVVFSPTEDALVVEGSELPPPNGDATYQLWLVDDDAATPVGVFGPGADGEVRARFDGVDPTGFVLGVTVEPAGGSEQPTLPIVASA